MNSPGCEIRQDQLPGLNGKRWQVQGTDESSDEARNPACCNRQWCAETLGQETGHQRSKGRHAENQHGQDRNRATAHRVRRHRLYQRIRSRYLIEHAETRGNQKQQGEREGPRRREQNERDAKSRRPEHDPPAETR